MARRNGRGSKSLAETINQFERAQIKLLQAVEEVEILTSRETERLTKRFEKSSAQKRSSDVLAAAIHMSKLLCSSLRARSDDVTSKGGGEMDVLGEMAAALRADNGPRESLDRLLELTRELIPFNQAAVFLFDRERQQLRPVTSIGGHIDLIQGIEFELGSGFSAWVASRETPILLNDLQRPTAPGELPLRSFMSAPIVVHGELMGVLNLGGAEARSFDEDHLRLLNVIAALLAATLTRVEAERLLGELAATDPLSGVLTHRSLDTRIGEEIDRSRRYGDALTFALFEIDRFDTLRDSFGLKLANQVVADFGRLLRTNARNCDVIGRVGDHQIGILFVHTSAGDARLAAERLAAQVQAHSFPRRKRLRARFSLAAFPEGGEDLTGLLTSARRRLAAAANADLGAAAPFDRVVIG